MIELYSIALGALLFAATEGRENDYFNYEKDNKEENGGRSFGQPQWNDVTCDSVNKCTGYPDKFPYAKGWSQAGPSNCRWCPADDSQKCGLHWQSPIDLQRDRAVLGGPNWKECPDWHWIHHIDDSCTWDDMKDHFTIERHGLHMNVPQLPNGDIDCIQDGQRRYAKVDYSKGFPDWFLLQRMEIQVPSQHTQEGNRYDGELIFQHFYEKDHVKNQAGYVSMFLQGYTDVQSWPYLDKLICAWRQAEEKVREKCGLPPAPAYGRCKLFRGQDPPDDWTGESTIQVNTSAPFEDGTSAPTAVFAAQSPTASAPTNATSNGEIATNTTNATTPSTIPFKTASPSSVPPPALSTVPSLTAWPTISSPPSFLSSSITTSVPLTISGDVVPPTHTCKDLKVDYSRMCVSLDPCCETTRSDTDFCWSVYDILGSAITSACYHCCPTPKIVGPPNPEKSGLPKTVQCSTFTEVFRMCKPDSCCTNPRSKTTFCQSKYSEYGENMEQLCHYCCRVPNELGPARRLIELEDANITNSGPTPPKLPVDDFLKGIQQQGTPTSKPVLAPKALPMSIKAYQNLTTFPMLQNESSEEVLAVQELKDGPTQPPIAFAKFLEQLNTPSTNFSIALVPPMIDCMDGKVNYERMCYSLDPCCEDKISASKFCWESYDILGDAVASACYHCCDTPKIIGSFPPVKEDLPKTIQCSAVDNPTRICKVGGCCSSPRSTTTYCVEQYAKYNDTELEEICHYCCPTPISLNSTAKRGLRSDAGKGIPELDPNYVPEGANVVEVGNRRFVIRKENSVPKDYEKFAKDYEAQHTAYQRRAQVDTSRMYMEDYLDVDYWPYEAFMKVNTEYYHRYEGSMLVPPCWEIVHWRNFKDPIQLHTRQIDELNRLLAWRLNPDTCQVDTAGILSEDKNRVEMKREIQRYTSIHRKVFCECQDWPSRFESDRKWCRKWHADTNYSRFYEHMYSFDSGGKWLPTQPAQ